MGTRNQIALDNYGLPYNSLAEYQQIIVDDLFRDQLKYNLI